MGKYSFELEITLIFQGDNRKFRRRKNLVEFQNLKKKKMHLNGSSSKINYRKYGSTCFLSN